MTDANWNKDCSKYNVLEKALGKSFNVFPLFLARFSVFLAWSFLHCAAFVREAIAADNDGDVKNAYHSYRTALDHFFVFLKFEKNPKSAEAVEAKVSKINSNSIVISDSKNRYLCLYLYIVPCLASN